MPPEIREELEPRLGNSLGDVRVHTDAAAGGAAQQLAADAFTVGRDIYFAPGRYQPASGPGRRLLAHELAHVRQWDPEPQSSPPHTEVQVSHPQDSAERAAEAVADALTVPQAPSSPLDAARPASAQPQVQRQAAGGAITLPEIDIVAVAPRSLRSAIGTLGYYRLRHDDFMARADVGETPPDYMPGDQGERATP